MFEGKNEDECDEIIDHVTKLILDGQIAVVDEGFRVSLDDNRQMVLSLNGETITLGQPQCLVLANLLVKVWDKLSDGPPDLGYGRFPERN